LVAVKRVRGMRLLSPAWKTAPSKVGKQVSVANRGAEFQQTETDD